LPPFVRTTRSSETSSVFTLYESALAASGETPAFAEELS
jgi:hypothetical protein